MRRGTILSLAFGLLLVIVPGLGSAQDTGAIEGTVSFDNGSPVGGVTVVIEELSMAELTNDKGYFRISGVPAGDYSISFTLSANSARAEGVAVTAGATTELEQMVEWDVSYAETITVYSASRRRERIVEAPSAITVIPEEEIERQGSHGQLPKLLEFTPGAEITQSGLYDFNLNTRGFNSSLNRRVPTLLDGRDPSIPFLMAQDWPSMSALEDLASVELVRGPSSALYGTNAYNGVLNLTTKQPKFSQGGTFRITGGELNTLRGDFRGAAHLGNEWYVKAMLSYTESDDFYQSRCIAGLGPCPADSPAPEYEGLPVERVPIATDRDKLGVGTIRLDKYLFDNEHVFTVEGGYASIEGPPVTTGIGRVQVLESERPWVRMNWNAARFNAMTYYNKRDAPDQLALSSGANLVLKSDIWAAEIQGNLPFAGGKGQLVGGASYRDEEVDTENTLTFGPVAGDRTGIFGQVDYAFSDKFKAVVAARWDDSSLHDSFVSPKAALVFSPTPNNTIRFTYNEAFQSPNYSEFFLYAPTAISTPAGPITSLDLSAIEAGLCTPFGVDCGFGDPVIVRALGNQNLDIETVTTFELGYSGIIGGKVFLTADYYQSELEDFVTDLIANPFGTVNPDFGTYQAPDEHPFPGLLDATLRAALGPLYAFISNGLGGEAILALASYTNAGTADTQGVDLGLNWYVTNRWTFNFSYSWFDFELKEAAAGDVVEANAPEHSFRTGLGYVADRWDASVSYRWVDEFEWAAGVFVGTVPEYETVDIVANWRLTDAWSLGLNIANALDSDHFESFGGDRLGRRALGNVAFTW